MIEKKAAPATLPAPRPGKKSMPGFRLPARISKPTESPRPVVAPVVKPSTTPIGKPK